MMEISGSVLQDMMRSTVSVGDVFLIEMDENDGITPKDGDGSRNKYFVVLGFDGRCVSIRQAEKDAADGPFFRRRDTR